MKKSIYFFTCFFLSFAVSLAAEVTMTWQDCVEEMIRNNPQLKASGDTVEKARLDVMSKYSLFMPQISASGDIGKSKSEGSEGYSESTSSSIGISARQTLFAGFGNDAALERSRALLTVSRMSFERMKADLSYMLRNAFSQMLYAQEFVRLSDAIVARRKDNLNLVELRFEAGREHKGSFLRSRAFFREAEYDAAQARRSLAVARRQLATAMGRQENDPRLSIKGEWMVVDPDPDPPFLELVARTPDHQAAEARYQAARESVRGARSEFYPSLSASASIGRHGDDWDPDRDRWSVGLSLSLPLFTGGRTLYGMRGALADQRVAEFDLADSDNQLATILEQRFSTWQDAVERLGVQRDFLEAAEVRAEIARSQYSNGLLSFQDWDAIENDLISQERAMLASRRDAVLAAANWHRAIGAGVIP